MTPLKKAAIKDVVMTNGVQLVSIQETKMEKITPADLRILGTGKLNDFVVKPSTGPLGGILMMWDGAVWNKINSAIGEFSVAVVLEDCASGWRWLWTGVYGPQEDTVRVGLLEELSGYKSREVVEASWNEPVLGLRGAKKLAFKLKRLKVTLKKWGLDQKLMRRQKKAEIEQELGMLDGWEELAPLSEEDRKRRSLLKEDWRSILRMEEAEWHQRSREIWLKEDDDNTKFFHKAACQRHRVNKISQLLVEGQLVEDPGRIEESLVQHFTEAFQKWRRWVPEWFDENIGRVPDRYWHCLEAPFTEEEVQRAIFGTEADKAPGPDGFGFRFYQTFWLLVKPDVMEVFSEFFSGSTGVGCLNATFIALVPKKEVALEVGDFRLISLVNGSLKMITKVLANRLKVVLEHMIEKNQTAFNPGRLLQDGFMAVQECVSAVHRDKRQGGLRQGDPLSPLLFVIVTNVFSRMLKLAEEDGWFKASDVLKEYADDTIILCEAEESSIEGVMLICKCFELLSGLKVNFGKSAILGINVERHVIQGFAQILNCQTQEFPVRYLGLPLHVGRFTKVEWLPLIERFERRLEGWKSKLLSYGGRLVLHQAILSNLPIFFLSIFKVPKGILSSIDGIRKRFLWNGAGGDRKKTHLVKWELVCSRKRLGGAGIIDLEGMNKALNKWK
ncbi:hypothetical protein QJS10_CPA01g01725 [Acorus calamus]|uniref:Reverse transcriptase domain-containing protein n=1 Tax=Acorus calamus TaxID=4465 RepID=A0AAV9FM89_ACOCL|nr:hypothetical protein QJS10_CPA01g01725 [Acorus calamus]